MDGALAWALPLARFIHDAALTLLFGGLLFPLYAHPAGDGRGRLQPWLLAEAVVALGSSLALFCLSVGGMAGSLSAAADPRLLWSTAVGDQLGWLFLARAALLVACTLLLRRSAGGAVATVCAGAALAGLALTGHAREGQGWVAAAHGTVDAVHLLCAGLWVGALPWFAVLLAPGQPPAAQAVRRFSRMAVIAVGLLLLSGVAATLLLVGSPLALLTTLWGRLLLVKVALAFLMVALAVHNRNRATPALESGGSEAAKRLRRNALVELALAFAVLALVGWMGTLPFMPEA